MDYWANVHAVEWFVQNVWPDLKSRYEELRFAIVGSNPAPDVQRLADEPGIMVTGRVPDVRPWIAGAKVSVAPLRIARGVQNKVLEAMAMGTPIAATPEAVEGISCSAPDHMRVASRAEAMVTEISALLEDREGALDMAARARDLVEKSYQWDAQLARLGQKIDSLVS